MPFYPGAGDVKRRVNSVRHHHSFYTNHSNLVSRLSSANFVVLFYCVDFNIKTQKMPLLLLCSRKAFDIAKMLLEQQIPETKKRMLLESCSATGRNCFFFAAVHVNIEAMRYFLTEIKELNISARSVITKETVYYACFSVVENSPVPNLEMIKMLHDVDNDLINYLDGLGRTYLHIAVTENAFDVFKLLIELGVSVHHKSYEKTDVLKMAALYRRVNCIRYLLYEMDCDPCSRDMFGWPTCNVFIQCVLNPSSEQGIPTKEEIEFAVELLSLTYNSTAETIEVYFLLLDCFRFDDNRCDWHYYLFLEIVKLLTPTHQKQQLIEKFLNAKLPRGYCLITLILFEMVDKYICNNCQLIHTEQEAYLRYFEDLKSYLLRELFTLYLADEPLFNEYIAEIIRIGWTFCGFELMSKFCETLTGEMSSQKIFDFMKSLLLTEFNFKSLMQSSPLLLSSNISNTLSKIFVPLSNFVHVPIELIWIFGSLKKNCHYNFDESENCIIDYNALVKKESNHFEAVSLKNLSRMSIRKYFFQTYTHYEALSMLYSLDIPLPLRQFLCYNYSNLQF